MEPNILHPQTERIHKYAVGLLVQGGVVPLQSYASIDELKNGYRKFYRFARDKGLTSPIAIEKQDDDSGWNNGKCLILQDLMLQLSSREDQLRNSREN